MPSKSPVPAVHFVTLGCPKNRVDSELMLGQMLHNHLSLAEDPEDADVIVVNTCGFIHDAKEESIEVVVDMARHRAEGRAKRLIVTGCLAQRYPEALKQEIPEIDALVGAGLYEEVARHAMEAASERALEPVSIDPSPRFLHRATSPRVNSFLPHSAYVKIAEGCDQRCSFCIIPKLRGPQRSRPVADIKDEVTALAERGIVEVNLIAQDLTGYGSDLGTDLAALLEALSEVPGIRWIRPHYLYPRPFSDALIAQLASGGPVVPYVDMPLQHISDPILKRMKRGKPRRFLEDLLGQLKAKVPNLTLRSSFIVGFPGETEADFEELCDFATGFGFDRVGLFKYSHEEDTTAYQLDGLVSENEIEARYQHLTEALEAASLARQERYLRQTIEVLVDGVSEESDLLMAARHQGMAPEVDGVVYINDGQDSVKAGDFARVLIEDAFAYDLVGPVVEVSRPAPSRPDHAWLGRLPVI